MIDNGANNDLKIWQYKYTTQQGLKKPSNNIIIIILPPEEILLLAL